MPPSTSGKYGVPSRCTSIARLPPHSLPLTSTWGLPSATPVTVWLGPARQDHSWSRVNCSGSSRTKSSQTMGPAKLARPVFAIKPMWKAVKSL